MLWFVFKENMVVNYNFFLSFLEKLCNKFHLKWTYWGISSTWCTYPLNIFKETMPDQFLTKVAIVLQWGKFFISTELSKPDPLSAIKYKF